MPTLEGDTNKLAHSLLLYRAIRSWTRLLQHAGRSRKAENYRLEKKFLILSQRPAFGSFWHSVTTVVIG
jgi:hypothetical protein